MPSKAALLDELVRLSALTGAAVARDPEAALAAAEAEDHGALRRRIEARMAPGWRGLDTCPEGGWVWVRVSPFGTPALRLARGEQWRRERRRGLPAPTGWAPCEPPSWDEEG